MRVSEWANVEEEWLWDGVCLLCRSVIVRAKIELQNGSKKNVKMGRKKGKKIWQDGIGKKKKKLSNLTWIRFHATNIAWTLRSTGYCELCGDLETASVFHSFHSLFPHMATWNESPLSTNLSKNLCFRVAHSSIQSVMETIENYDKNRKNKKNCKLHDRGNISTKHHIKNIHRHTYTCTKLNNNRKLTKKKSG